MENITCALSSTERRLEDCLSLIIETKANYFEPNAFRLSLNSCIQTLRTVTFILQKNKHSLSNFDEWYLQWQNKMREDTILKWIVKARNSIVKQGDLVTHSMAHVSVIESWYGNPIFEMEVPPLTETNNLARLLAKKTPKKEVLIVGLLRLERRWVASGLPDQELLSILTYSYQFLVKLLLDAHECLTNKESRSICPWYIDASKDREGLPPQLLTQEWDRTVWVDIESCEIMKPSHVFVEQKKEDLEKAARHYPNSKDSAKNLSTASNIEEESAACFERAKTVLKTDGYHITVAIVGYPDGKAEVKQLVMSDRAEKHMVIRSLANDIRETGATSIILITESWRMPVNDARLTRTGVESNSLEEVLQLVAANSKGETLTREVCFTKDENGAVLFGDERTVNNDISVNIIVPILEVWKMKP